MRAFLRFAISFFVLCLVVFSFAYFLGPMQIRQAFHQSASPVGQLKSTDSLQAPAPQQAPASASEGK